MAIGGSELTGDTTSRLRVNRMVVRRMSGVVVLLGVCLALVGCGPAGPGLKTPVSWAGGAQSSDAPQVDPNSSVQLLENGRAVLTDFPQGTSVPTEGGVCVDLSTDARFDGEATWVPRDEFGVVLSFADSSIVWASDNTGGTPDWRLAGFRICDGPQFVLSYLCGDLGFTNTEPCREP